MFYNPPINTAGQFMYQNLPQQKISLINKVNGLESAKAFQTAPNSEVVLFDADEDVFYLKSTDASNYPSIRVFRFEEVKPEEPSSSGQYVTKDEFEQFKKEILSGKQHIRNGYKPSSKHNKQSAAIKSYDADSEQFGGSKSIYPDDVTE